MDFGLFGNRVVASCDVNKVSGRSAEDWDRYLALPSMKAVYAPLEASGVFEHPLGKTDDTYGLRKLEAKMHLL